MGKPAAASRKTPESIALRNYAALILDMDGVVTQTAKLHASAWKKMFDAFLNQHASQGDSTEGEFTPFSIVSDYPQYLDGKTREDGIRSFLKSRGIALPEELTADKHQASIESLGDEKNRIFHELLLSDGVSLYMPMLRLIEQARIAGRGIAVVSGSKNCALVLRRAGITDLFDTRVDGVTARECQLKGKPAPDLFLEAARRLKVDPVQAAMFEDSLSGVEAGRAGGFGLVVGVDRTGHSEELYAHGADVVVQQLSELKF